MHIRTHICSFTLDDLVVGGQGATRDSRQRSPYHIQHFPAHLTFSDPGTTSPQHDV